MCLYGGSCPLLLPGTTLCTVDTTGLRYTILGYEIQSAPRSGWFGPLRSLKRKLYNMWMKLTDKYSFIVGAN